ncbi:MAG: hypothetical protein WDA22_11760 [Bacteroidota bacterium]
MNKIKYVVIVLVSIGFGVLIGIFVKPNPLAKIDIANLSKKVVKTVDIVVGATTYVVGNIEQGKSKSVNVFVAGEVGYSLKVNFANGDTLVTWSYVETSNKINTKVYDSSLVSVITK